MGRGHISETMEAAKGASERGPASGGSAHAENPFRDVLVRQTNACMWYCDRYVYQYVVASVCRKFEFQSNARGHLLFHVKNSYSHENRNKYFCPVKL